jgi:hypothetical protein
MSCTAGVYKNCNFEIDVAMLQSELDRRGDKGASVSYLRSALKGAVELDILPSDLSTVMYSKKTLKPFATKYRAALISQGLSASSINSKISRFYKLSGIYTDLVVQQSGGMKVNEPNLPALSKMELPKALHAVSVHFWGAKDTEHGYCKRLAEIGGFQGGSTVTPWYRGESRPTYNQRYGFNQLEARLNLPPNSLSCHTKMSTEFIEKDEDDAFESNTAKPYMFTPQQELELGAYYRFKTTGGLPDGCKDDYLDLDLNLEKNDYSFSAIFPENFEPDGGSEWGIQPDGSVSSFTEFKRKVRVYYRYLRDDVNLIDNEINLSKLMDSKLLRDYISSRAKDGKYSSTIGFLKRLGGFFKLQTSYFARYHVLPDFIPENKNEIERKKALWGEYLIDKNGQIGRWIKQLKKKHKRLDGKRNVAFIFDDWAKLDDMRELLLAQTNNGFTYVKRHLFSTYTYSEAAMLLKAGLENPLRCSNWTDLKLLNEEPEILSSIDFPALFCRSDGRYHLRVPATHLKNGIPDDTDNDLRLSARGGHTIDYVFSVSASADIKRHLAVRQEFLDFEGAKSDYLCLKENYEKTTASGFSSRLVRTTNRVMRTLWTDKDYRYGINPHSLRHLSAMLILKKCPGRFDLVATALQDSLDMAQKTYGGNDHKSNYQEIANIFS